MADEEPQRGVKQRNKIVMSQEEIAEIRETATIEVQAAVAQAQQEPVPDPYLEDWRAYHSQFDQSQS
jgi:TPP-dependent pyruvate/acetoin dehydrogenase alpha subunit